MLGLAPVSSLKDRPMHSPYKLDVVRSGNNKGMAMVDERREKPWWSRLKRSKQSKQRYQCEILKHNTSDEPSMKIVYGMIEFHDRGIGGVQ